jgi:hypothetical protein
MEFSEWSKGVLESWSGAKRKTRLGYRFITPSPHMKSVRCPVAKEVGMGNPAEKTTRHPTKQINIMNPSFGKYIFAQFLRKLNTPAKKRVCAQLIVNRRLESDNECRLLVGKRATNLGCKLLKLRMFCSDLGIGFFHPIHHAGARRADIWVAGENISLLVDRFPAANANP